MAAAAAAAEAEGLTTEESSSTTTIVALAASLVPLLLCLPYLVYRYRRRQAKVTPILKRYSSGSHSSTIDEAALDLLLSYEASLAGWGKVRTHFLGEEGTLRVVRLLDKTLAESVSKKQSLAKTFKENVAKSQPIAEAETALPPALSAALARQFELMYGRKPGGGSELLQLFKDLLAQSAEPAPKPLVELISDGAAFMPPLDVALTAQFEKEYGRQPLGDHELLELLKAVVGSRDGVIGATELGAFSAIAHSAYQQVKGGDAPSEAEALVVLQERMRMDELALKRAVSALGVLTAKGWANQLTSKAGAMPGDPKEVVRLLKEILSRIEAQAKPVAGYTPADTGLQAKLSRALAPELRLAVAAAYQHAHGWQPNPREEINFIRALLRDVDVGFVTAGEVANLLDAVPFSSKVFSSANLLEARDVPKAAMVAQLSQLQRVVLAQIAHESVEQPRAAPLPDEVALAMEMEMEAKEELAPPVAKKGLAPGWDGGGGTRVAPPHLKALDRDLMVVEEEESEPLPVSTKVTAGNWEGGGGARIKPPKLMPLDRELMQMGQQLLLEADVKREQLQKQSTRERGRGSPQGGVPMMPMTLELGLDAGFEQQEAPSMPHEQAERIHRRSMSPSRLYHGGKRASLEEAIGEDVPLARAPTFGAKAKLPPIVQIEEGEPALDSSMDEELNPEQDAAVVAAALEVLKRQPSLRGVRVPTEAMVRDALTQANRQGSPRKRAKKPAVPEKAAGPVGERLPLPWELQKQKEEEEKKKRGGVVGRIALARRWAARLGRKTPAQQGDASAQELRKVIERIQIDLRETERLLQAKELEEAHPNSPSKHIGELS